MNQHVSVMLNEVLEAIQPCEKVEVFVDATLGLAGHSVEVLRQCKNARIIGFDQDSYARKIAKERLSPYKGRFEVVAENFRNIKEVFEDKGWDKVSAVLFDLGVSNIQLSNPIRGFSFQNDGPLNMRMDSKGNNASTLTAENILKEWSIGELTRIFKVYGEDPNAYYIARGIVRHRESGKELKTTEELVELIREILPAPVQRKMKGHPARRIFQALRIAVNDELAALDQALDGAIDILKPEGKIIVISYHSLEDRIVKKRFRKWQEEFKGEQSPRRAIKPTESEIEENYKSRSARMRIFKKTIEKGGAEDVLQRIWTRS